jgi:hypothetical protein
VPTCFVQPTRLAWHQPGIFSLDDMCSVLSGYILVRCKPSSLTLLQFQECNIRTDFSQEFPRQLKQSIYHPVSWTEYAFLHSLAVWIKSDTGYELMNWNLLLMHFPAQSSCRDPKLFCQVQLKTRNSKLPFEPHSQSCSLLVTLSR